MSCVLCDKTESIQKLDFPYFITEFKHSYWILGDHQFFKGYSQIIYKEHIRDMHDLDLKVQSELFMEVMKADEITRKVLNPWKMNFGMYGNVVPHIHWHLFPRYETEVDNKKPPMVYMDEFSKHPTSNTDYKKLIADFRMLL